MNFQSIARLIEDAFQRRPWLTVLAGAFAGVVLAAIPLNFVPPWLESPWLLVWGELAGIVIGIVTVVRIGRRSQRRLAKLDRELDDHFHAEAKDLYRLLGMPRRVSRRLRVIAAGFWRELGREAENYGRQYYDAPQPPRPGDEPERRDP